MLPHCTVHMLDNFIAFIERLSFFERPYIFFPPYPSPPYSFLLYFLLYSFLLYSSLFFFVFSRLQSEISITQKFLHFTLNPLWKYTGRSDPISTGISNPISTGTSEPAPLWKGLSTHLHKHSGNSIVAGTWHYSIIIAIGYQIWSFHCM